MIDFKIKDEKCPELPLFVGVGVKVLSFNGSPDSTVVLVCICVCFGGTVTVPALDMDTVFRTQKLKWSVLPFSYTVVCIVNIVTLVNHVFRHRKLHGECLKINMLFQMFNLLNVKTTLTSWKCNCRLYL